MSRQSKQRNKRAVASKLGPRFRGPRGPRTPWGQPLKGQ